MGVSPTGVPGIVFVRPYAFTSSSQLSQQKQIITEKEEEGREVQVGDTHEFLKDTRVELAFCWTAAVVFL
jgi:hypothetical protein